MCVKKKKTIIKSIGVSMLVLLTLPSIWMFVALLQQNRTEGFYYFWRDFPGIVTVSAIVAIIMLPISLCDYGSNRNCITTKRKFFVIISIIISSLAFLFVIGVQMIMLFLVRLFGYGEYYFTWKGKSFIISIAIISAVIMLPVMLWYFGVIGKKRKSHSQGSNHEDGDSASQ